MASRTTGRTRLLVFWDFQNEARSANRVRGVSDGIGTALHTRFGGASFQLFKAFGGASQSSALDQLEEAGWRCWTGDADMDGELIAQARGDCGQDLGDTVFVLIAKDRDYSEMISDLREQGVDVYVGQLGGNISAALRAAVGGRHVINL